MSLDDLNSEDPKDGFNQSAGSMPEGQSVPDTTPEQLYIGGDDRETPDEERSSLDDILGDDQQDEQAEMRKKRDKGLWERYHDRFKWGIKEHEKNGVTFMSVSARGKPNPQTGMRELTDKQLAAVILKMTLDNGFHTLYFYRGKDIDPSLSQRAGSMIEKMQRPGGPLEGYDVQVSPSRMPVKEPWVNIIERMQRSHNEHKAAKAGRKETKKFEKMERKVMKDALKNADLPPKDTAPKDGQPVGGPG